MKLDENYSLTHDSNCWILMFDKDGDLNEETGRPKHSHWETYHVSCKQALEKYIDSKMKEVDGLYPIWVDELYKSIESSYAKLKDL